MANVAKTCGGSSSSWFINIPKGNWILKSTAKSDVFPGFGENVIPLCIDVSASYNGSPRRSDQRNDIDMVRKGVDFRLCQII